MPWRRPEQSVAYADESGDEYEMLSKRTTHADALHAGGRRGEAERLFVEAEGRQKKVAALATRRSIRCGATAFVTSCWQAANGLLDCERASKTLENCQEE